MDEVPADAVAALFAPERPGPMIHPHITATGVGRCRADRVRDPRTAVAELPGGNVACRGEPVVVPDLRGFVEAPPRWVPALRAVGAVGVWDRIVAALPDGADPAVPGTEPAPDLDHQPGQHGQPGRRGAAGLRAGPRRRAVRGGRADPRRVTLRSVTCPRATPSTSPGSACTPRSPATGWSAGSCAIPGSPSRTWRAAPCWV